MNLTRKILVGVICISILIGIVLLITLLPGNHSVNDSLRIVSECKQEEYFSKAAVTANGKECASIGLEILKKRGSVADAAIATMFCEGVACPQCMGLGGGFLLTIYTNSTGEVEVLNAREVAPGGATDGMFEGGRLSTVEGGLASAVPGELRGYGELHKRYGRLPWSDLIAPAIELCQRGHEVSEYLARILQHKRETIMSEPSLKEIYVNPNTNDVWKEGDLVRRPDLALTLRIIAQEGSDAMHDGSLTDGFVGDVRSFGGILTRRDMKNYRPLWTNSHQIDFGNDHVLHTVPLPGSGPLLSLIVNTLRGWAFPSNTDDDDIPLSAPHDWVVFWHRIVETFKYTFAIRSDVGDANYLPAERIDPILRKLESPLYANLLRQKISDNRTFNDPRDYDVESYLGDDHGTAHISILAENGDAVAVTSTVNYVFGALRRSPNTGIILNNEMDDFSYPNISNVYGLPPSPSNFPRPGKRPLSSMMPSLVVRKGRGVRVVMGAAGGTKILTQVALVLMKHLLHGEPLSKAMNDPRLHHQLFPMVIQHEPDFDKDIIKGLQRIGHKTDPFSPITGFATISAISVNQTTGKIDAQFDSRRTGSKAGY